MSRDARRARRSAAREAPVKPPVPSLRDRLPRQTLRDVLILAALATLLYANSFGVPLILDSELLVVQDPRIRAVRSENLANIVTQDYMAARPAVTGVYRPVTTLSYLVNYTILGNGPRPAGYHVVNLLLHVGNAVLVYLLAGLLLRSHMQALCTAALFTAHPIATEAVTNVVGRADLLAALAVLGGTLLYVRSLREVGPAKRRWLIGLGVVMGLGLLAKENAVALVGVVVAYDFAYGAAAASPEDARRSLGERVRAYLALVVPVLAVALVRWRVYAGAVVQRPSFVDNPLVGADFWTARLTALKVLGHSVALLLWPSTLSWDYSYDQIPLVHWPLEGWEDWQAPLALVGAIAAVVVAVRSRRRRPALCFFLLFALMTILPTANLIVPIGTISADRFLYLPSVGVAACVVMGLAAIAGRLRDPVASALTPAAVAVLVLALGVRTMARNVDWSDEVRLAQSGIESAPRSAKVYLAYASALAHQGGTDADAEALIAHTEQALSIMDARPLPTELQESNIPLLLGIFYKMKGTQLTKRGEYARPWYLRSVEMLERATAIQTAQNDEYRRASLARGLRDDQIVELGGYELPYHLGEAHMLLGEPAKAVEDFARLRRRAPLLAQSHLSTARAATATGDNEGAVRALTIAVVLGKRDVQTQGLLVEAYRRLDPHGCAVSMRDGHAELDGKCPLVKTHLCAAYVELMELSIEAKEWYLGRRVGEAAIKTGDCDAAPFEKLLARVAERNR